MLTIVSFIIYVVIVLDIMIALRVREAETLVYVRVWKFNVNEVETLRTPMCWMKRF